MMNKEWIVTQLEKIAQFSQSAESSEAAAKIHQYVASLMTEAGLMVRVDQIGNTIGRLETRENQACPCILTGSSVEGGILGILTAIAAVHKLNKEAPFSHPMEVVLFAGAEYRAFGSLIGSKLASGILSARTLGMAKDQEGTMFAEFMLRQGLDIKNMATAKLSAQDVKAFLELNREDGHSMAKHGLQIGIAENITGITKCKITVTGSSTPIDSPMDERQDALVSAAMIILAVQEIGQQSQNTISIAITSLKVLPGSPNFIPGSIEMWLDIRSIDQESIIETLQEVKDAVSTITESQETTVSIDMLSVDKPICLSKEVTDVIKEVCQGTLVTYGCLNCSTRCDAANMASKFPAGLILLPGDSKDKASDIEVGLTILTRALYQLAK